jgi:hypothetical protein
MLEHLLLNTKVTLRPQMTSAPDPMDALNDLAMQLFGKPLDMLTPSERQALDEYNSGMMAVGGRVNYGIGSKLKKFAKKVIDPVAQVAAFIPGVHQPFAQGYTALRASGVGGDNYGGLQVLGMTPGAGQFQHMEHMELDKVVLDTQRNNSFKF